MNIGSAIQSEIHAPFSSQMDMIHLFLLVGLVMVFAVLWSRVLVHIERAASML